MDKWSLEHETKQSPVVLLCYAHLCMWLCGDFPVTIPFPFWQPQYRWLHVSENFNVSEWRILSQCWPTVWHFFPTTRNKSVAQGRGLGFFLFCFQKRFSWIDPVSRQRLQMKQALTIPSHLFTCMCWCFYFRTREHLSLLSRYLWARWVLVSGDNSTVLQ